MKRYQINKYGGRWFHGSQCGAKSGEKTNSCSFEFVYCRRHGRKSPKTCSCRKFYFLLTKEGKKYRKALSGCQYTQNPCNNHTFKGEDPLGFGTQYYCNGHDIEEGFEYDSRNRYMDETGRVWCGRESSGFDVKVKKRKGQKSHLIISRACHVKCYITKMINRIKDHQRKKDAVNVFTPFKEGQAPMCILLTGYKPMQITFGADFGRTYSHWYNLYVFPNKIIMCELDWDENQKCVANVEEIEMGNITKEWKMVFRFRIVVLLRISEKKLLEVIGENQVLGQPYSFGGFAHCQYYAIHELHNIRLPPPEIETVDSTFLTDTFSPLLEPLLLTFAGFLFE